MSTFNHRMLKKQELLAKEDIKLIIAMLDKIELDKIEISASMERITFLRNKLKRMLQ